jgi:hypothetical protein
MLITLFINIREQVEVFMLKKKVRDMFRKLKTRRKGEKPSKTQMSCKSSFMVASEPC